MIIKRCFLSSIILGWFTINAFATTESSSPKETIYNFYKSYFSSLNNKLDGSTFELTYSRSFSRLINYNEKLCKSFPDEICGWGADGDVYLDAQDYGKSLTIKNTRFQIHESPVKTINVSFYLFPSDTSVRDNQRHISYKMIYENHQWVVDDIIYNKSISARKQIDKENKFLNAELRSKTTNS